MYSSPEHEQDPDKVFQGLGFRGWLRLVLRTRAGTIKQCDELTDALLGRLTTACREAENAKRNMKVMADVMVMQYGALESARDVLCNLTSCQAREVTEIVTEAIEATLKTEAVQ